MEQSFIGFFVYLLLAFSFGNAVDALNGVEITNHHNKLSVQGQVFDDLSFHHICGQNVFVIDNGRTLRKKTNGAYDYVYGFTHRPLYDNEIFQVRANAVDGNSVQIGVMKGTPENVPISTDMAYSPYTWMFYNARIFINGNKNTRNDGIQLSDLMVEETIGVMRDSSGNLHLIVDGTDIGVAASNIPPNVYGIVDFYKAGPRATIDYSYLPHS